MTDQLKTTTDGYMELSMWWKQSLDDAQASIGIKLSLIKQIHYCVNQTVLRIEHHAPTSEQLDEMLTQYAENSKRWKNIRVFRPAELMTQMETLAALMDALDHPALSHRVRVVNGGRGLPYNFTFVAAFAVWYVAQGF